MILVLWSAEEPDVAWRDDVIAGLNAANLSRKETAAIIGVSEPQLSAMLALREHWSDWRARKLPVAFHLTVAKRRLARLCGARVVEDHELGAVMKKLDEIQVRMLSMQIESRKEGAA